MCIGPLVSVWSCDRPSLGDIEYVGRHRVYASRSFVSSSDLFVSWLIRTLWMCVCLCGVQPLCFRCVFYIVMYRLLHRILIPLSSCLVTLKVATTACNSPLLILTHHLKHSSVHFYSCVGCSYVKCKSHDWLMCYTHWVIMNFLPLPAVSVIIMHAIHQWHLRASLRKLSVKWAALDLYVTHSHWGVQYHQCGDHNSWIAWDGQHQVWHRLLYSGNPSIINAYPALIADITRFSIVPPFIFPELINPFILCHPSLVYAQTILSIKSTHVYPISIIQIST